MESLPFEGPADGAVALKSTDVVSALFCDACMHVMPPDEPAQEMPGRVRVIALPQIRLDQ